MKLSVARQGSRLLISLEVSDPTTGEAIEATSPLASVYVYTAGVLSAVPDMTDIDLVAPDSSDGIYLAAPAIPAGYDAALLVVVARCTAGAVEQAATALLASSFPAVGGPKITVTPGPLTTHDVR